MSELQEPLDLPETTQAVDAWLTKFRAAFDIWKQQYPQSARATVETSWLELLRWHAALELSFTQLVEHNEDQADLADAQQALDSPGAATSMNHIILGPLAQERLDALSTESREHLLQVHLSRLAEQPHPQDAERLRLSDDVYRIRAHDCRIIYKAQGDGVLVLAVTPGHRLLVKN